MMKDKDTACLLMLSLTEPYEKHKTHGMRGKVGKETLQCDDELKFSVGVFRY